MAKKPKIPSTMAVRTLRGAKADFEPHFYAYEARGGTAKSSAELGVEEHAVIKTLIMEDEHGEPLVVLMHGDLQVSTKALAREIGCKVIRPCEPKVADKHSGYKVGGTSPFGLRRAMPVYAEASIQDLEKLYINGGRQGFLVSMTPETLENVLSPKWLEVSTTS